MSKRLKVSIATEHAPNVNIGKRMDWSGLAGIPPVGFIVGIERDSDEFTIVTVELEDDEAELEG